MTEIIEHNIPRDETAALIAAARAGDRDAFGELVVRYEAAVYATALRQLGNHAEAEELTQDVFVQAYERLYQLRDPRRFGGWLRSITVRMAINRRTRCRQPASADPEIFEATATDDNSPVDRAVARERAAGLHSGLARLGELDRATLVAFYLEGQSLVEMSDEFSSPVGTIKRRLHVARKRLAEQLGQLAAV
ncbi:MAG: sigma-70 family RNA polymerase sigma factor [Planctomycetota bacterium]|nr:MAG: sigma-70 family RNA polymerase sigma factor [Planctomycetota bacterium]REJ98528.1 MAG: sigma-70 family RNA polymerase sigma factor [Planctomycetota bacterium]REK29828.1 MAG: sigma-70 family RNA polymerase sigma factor [Planctomycetota bacterium]REK48001.1 MAG: sigma-70 family RNA polymerase sigma factor [Planctomycetota bacterium]